MINNPYKAYSNAQAMTATPEDLTLMLYNGALRFLTKGMAAIDEKNIEQANTNILKVQDIVLELMSTLKMEYEVSANLMSLYDFMYRHLVQANVKKDKKSLEDVYELMEQLRDTWSEAMKIARKPAVGMNG
jgi:flagellar protein FliS